VRKDKMWVHWVVVNIAPQDQIIEKNHAPKGIKGKGTAGSLDWQGPCPPDREHRYFFKLYALDVPLTLQQGASKREVEAAMRGHILTEAQLMGRYERQGG
jgi:Raf kinase inhibitor-like YbhB/YbcL family protein